MMFIKMEEPKDFGTWKQVAKVLVSRTEKWICCKNLCLNLQCLKIWDLDARGYHNSMWRMHMKGSELLVIGVPNSDYS
jgi:hypothetical protein